MQNWTWTLTSVHNKLRIGDQTLHTLTRAQLPRCQNHCTLHLVNAPYNCKEKCALQLILHKFSMFRLETCNWSASAAFPGRKNQEEGCSSNLIIWSRNFLEKMRNFLKSDLNWIEEFPRRKTKHWELFSCAGPSSNLCNMTSANLLWGLHVLALRSSFGKVQESLESQEGLSSGLLLRNVLEYQRISDLGH